MVRATVVETMRAAHAHVVTTQPNRMRCAARTHIAPLRTHGETNDRTVETMRAAYAARIRRGETEWTWTDERTTRKAETRAAGNEENAPGVRARLVVTQFVRKPCVARTHETAVRVHGAANEPTAETVRRAHAARIRRGLAEPTRGNAAADEMAVETVRAAHAARTGREMIRSQRIQRRRPRDGPTDVRLIEASRGYATATAANEERQTVEDRKGRRRADWKRSHPWP